MALQPRFCRAENRLSAASPRRDAFSLLELLVVIAIMTAMAVLLAPIAVGMLRSQQLTVASQAIVNQLTLARQKALVSGYAVQVRLYFLPPYSQPPGSATPSLFRGIQCFSEGDPVLSGSASVPPLTALGSPVYFQSDVAVLNDASKSTLLNLPVSDPSSQQKLGAYGNNYRFLSFRFKPDGRPDLPDTASGLTLVLDHDPVQPGGLPKNFCLVEIDLLTGSIRTFRP